MSIYVKDASVVLDGGSVATNSNCCCGVCCNCEETCDHTVTQGECESNGGQWFPTDNCGDNPCDTLIKGACCNGTDCSIKTQDCCEFDGGTYQGDDTLCDPNPCHPTCLCGFDAFDGSGRKFLTRTIVSSGSYDAPPPSGCTGTATNVWSSTRVDTIDGTTCEQSCVSVSGSAEVDVPWTGPGCTPCTSSGLASCSGGNTIFCGFGSEAIVFYTECDWTFSPIHCSDGVQAACAVCTPSQTLSATEAIFTWSCTPAPGGVNVNATQTMTLSDECTPS